MLIRRNRGDVQKVVNVALRDELLEDGHRASQEIERDGGFCAAD